MRSYQVHSRIRALSRAKYLNSNKPQKCIICGYKKHFDVCHIKAIQDFEDTSLVSEINSLDNLIALCKNHHWELDHDLLDDKDKKILAGVSPVASNHLKG